MIADSTVRSMCTIGQEISIWCEKNHIINQELADALAVSRETVKRIKNGTRELTSKEIRKLSVLMEKQADFFIPNDDELDEDTCQWHILCVWQEPVNSVLSKKATTELKALSRQKSISISSNA